MSRGKLAIKFNNDVGMVDTEKSYLTPYVEMKKTAHLSVDRKWLHGHKLTSILVKCLRDEVTSTKSICFLECQLDENNSFSQVQRFVDRANKAWNDAEPLIIGKHFCWCAGQSFNLPWLRRGETGGRVQCRSSSESKGGHCPREASDGSALYVWFTKEPHSELERAVIWLHEA